jgi:hypothetical protein
MMAPDRLKFLSSWSGTAPVLGRLTSPDVLTILLGKFNPGPEQLRFLLDWHLALEMNTL